MKRLTLGFTGLWCVMLALTGPAGAASSMEELWLFPGESSKVDMVQVSLEEQSFSDFSKPLPLTCHISSQDDFQFSYVFFRVYDQKENLVVSSELTLDLFEGENQCTFNWNAAPLRPGNYTASFEIDYTDAEENVWCDVLVKRVSETDLLERIAVLENKALSLQQSIQAQFDQDPPQYIQIRMNIAGDFIQRAKQARVQEDWHSMVAHVEYLEQEQAALEADLVFGSFAPEILENSPALSMAALAPKNGVMRSEEAPVFLFGQVLAQPDAAAMARLRRYGLNLAVFSLSPEDSLASYKDLHDFESRFNPLFSAAQEANLSVAVELAPHELGGWAMEQWPNMQDKGFVDIAHAGVMTAYERHLQAVLPYLAQQPNLAAASLCLKPLFKFDSEATRQRFLRYIKKQYPDRQELNRKWLTHFASYDEITIWDDSLPEHSYQHKRAFQFDFQSFHRQLATEYLTWVKKVAKEQAPSIPLMATLSDNVFETGESRMGVAREAVARMLDISGCSATTDPQDSYYALSYPRQSAFYTFMRSIEPTKAVFNLEDHVVIDDSLNPEERYDYVFSAMWEAVMSGMSATALAADTQVFAFPESTEAYALACWSINRLAPLVDAFRQAPVDVAVLFSDTSKIFDDGDPHLESAWYAYEGCSFSGYNVCYITEEQCQENRLESLPVLVVPETPALTNETFESILHYAENGGTIARVGTPIPYNEKGDSRYEVLKNTGNTVLVRGMNMPTEYLHGIDAAIVLGSLPRIPRPINAYGHPLEGVKSRYVTIGEDHYLYLINLRKETLPCSLAGGLQEGRDLIFGREVKFPIELESMKPMLIKLAPPVLDVVVETYPDGDAPEEY